MKYDVYFTSSTSFVKQPCVNLTVRMEELVRDLVCVPVNTDGLDTYVILVTVEIHVLLALRYVYILL